MKVTRLLPFACAVLLGLAGCSKDSSSETANTSKLEVRLIDAPGDSRSVVLDVRQVAVHLTEEKDPDGWTLPGFTPQADNVPAHDNRRPAQLVTT